MQNCIGLSRVDRDDRAFAEQRLCCFPFELQSILLYQYLQKPTKFERNSYLRVTTEEIAKKLSIPLSKLNLNLCEDDLRDNAKSLVTQVFDIRRQFLNDEKAIKSLRGFVTRQGINSLAEQFSLNGEVGRYCDDKWWLRRLRKELRRNIEAALHHLNQVNKKKSLYCSQLTLKARIKQKQYAEEYLANTIATNEYGQSFTLLELSKKGVSDPKIRKGELMVRARGFEDLAKELGHEATFLTITCPSKYHRSYSASGHENPKWGGYTPLDGQKYLNNIWKLIRSKLNRLGIRFYGFRVAEPQHDGTPHWHLLLFVDPSQYQEMIEIMRDYSMKEDREEKGAEEHRFTEVKIDPEKGSATGYIAKYISKNIDGSDLDSGVYGEDPLDAAARVDAWAACWGIRQFQQLGGCSVTVWRELRRLKETQGLDDIAQSIVEAADTGNWKVFTQKMGGVFCKRKEQVFQPHYEVSFDKDTGAFNTSQYCTEEFIRALKGVVTRGRELITRVYQWRIESQLHHAF
ncbi:replication endonuclease [uncultured Vibrio sp.]|uniref:replication endonuclease n=1 Tax=uncultured Vibrio sp. TaxID=114054 RepID=UPI00091CED5F|nr:replication endonuclease [uncultured Vibrio sp.]OIQ24887.1 MAG: replication protein [Vibrio sp. MedPE-SWchi]